jgi:lysyl-tRNA synthetase class II
VFRTRHGQISVSPTIWCCSPSPCCRCGEMARIKGPELRYRQRYVDLIVNPR